MIGRASIVDNWVICDSCEYESDFVAAAVTWNAGKTTRIRVSVGNPNTGSVYTMWVGGSGSPNSPLSIGNQIDDFTKTQKKYVFSEPTTSTITAHQLLEAKRSFSVASSGASEVNQDSAAEPVFQSLVIGSKNHLLFNVSSSDVSNSNLFNSFESAQQDMVSISLRLWQQETVANPTFGNFAPSATTGLVNALKAYFGHGILISIVFKNGDVATFEINPMHPDAARYVKGTAKNRDGNSLPDMGNPIGSGNSGGVSVSPITGGSGPVTAYGVGGTWLVCSYVGGCCRAATLQP